MIVTETHSAGRPAIETIGLTGRFGSVTAVDSASVGVQSGEIFGLIGPNGAGKSTLIKRRTTLLPPTAARALVAGFDLRSQAAQVRPRIGYVPQVSSADSELTGHENLLLATRLYPVPALSAHDALARRSNSWAAPACAIGWCVNTPAA